MVAWPASDDVKQAAANYPLLRGLLAGRHREALGLRLGRDALLHLTLLQFPQQLLRSPYAGLSVGVAGKALLLQLLILLTIVLVLIGLRLFGLINRLIVGKVLIAH